jgi:16S rRNA (guanine(966)-N(2))-methyltransferase RsmD
MQIQAGKFKGQKLLSPPSAAQTRPLTGLAKKSLFDTISAWLEGARVLDLYAGSGTMGLEALSRGADCCYLAEKDPKVVSRLKRNIQQLGLEDQAQIWVGDIHKHLSQWLRPLKSPLDLVFIDPPFAASGNWDLEEMGQALFAPVASHLAGDGLVVLRMPPKFELPERVGPLEVVRRRKKGSMGIFYLQKPGAP